MKVLVIVALCGLAFATATDERQNRAKRFAGFGTFSTVGGRIGCVVSENGPGNASLFINSHFTKFLSEDEQQELEQYKEKLTQFKSDVKAFLEERQKQALERTNQFRGGQGPAGGSFGGRNSQLSSNDAATTTESNSSPSSQPSAPTKQPEPPKKPSFCSEKATTQYVFDGCSVQGNNVYIGDNFVRKLTEKEQEELEAFDKQFTAYQKAITSSFKQQVEDIFGKQLGSLFSSSSISKSGSADVSAVEPSNETSASSTTAQPLEAPKTPNFCTLIV